VNAETGYDLVYGTGASVSCEQHDIISSVVATAASGIQTSNMIIIR
jgi:hypothetical protein